jgi:hypothetical protein
MIHCLWIREMTLFTVKSTWNTVQSDAHVQRVNTNHFKATHIFRIHDEILTTVLKYSYLHSFLAEVLWHDIDASPLPSQALLSNNQKAKKW